VLQREKREKVGKARRELAYSTAHKTVTMDPDELYTLRAQYWLGHYTLCLEEAKAIARRPMPEELKVEREEFVLRALLGLKQYDKVISEAAVSEGPGMFSYWIFIIFVF